MGTDLRRAILVALLAFAATLAALTLLRPPPEPEPAPSGATVRLRLVEPGGAPITACGATLWSELPDGGRRADADSNRECRDGLEWTELGPGRYRLFAAGTGKERVERQFELKENEVLDFGDIEMAPGGRVTGVVVENGAPVPDAQVRLPGGRTETTGRRGTFTMDGAPVGTLDLRAAKGRSGGGLTVELAQGQVIEVEIPIEAMPPRGVLGLRFDVEPEGLRVKDLHPAGPAAAAGVIIGDLILGADGKPAQNLDAKEGSALLAGEVGAPIELELDGGRRLRLVRVGDDTL